MTNSNLPLTKMASFIVNKIVSSAIASKVFNPSTSSCASADPKTGQPCCTVMKEAKKNNLPYCGPAPRTSAPKSNGAQKQQRTLKK
jgi:hypothetical protein